MNKTKRIFSLFLAVVMMLGVMLQMAACDPTDGNGEETTGAETGTVPATGEATYPISVKTVGGMPMGGILVYIYNEDGFIVSKATTDDNGSVSFKLDVTGTYQAELSGVPDGYNVKEKYDISANGTAITLSSGVIADQDLTGVAYKEGSIMHDFEVTLTDGTNFKLSEVLKEKKMVMINFWYTTCTYCVEEFPGMNSAYLNYKDKMEIIALNNYSSDSAAEVKDFQENYYQMKLEFPMAKDTAGVEDAFNVPGNPVSVVIDRFGMIALVQEGAITESQFNRIFDHFTKDEYEQKIYQTVSDLIPVEKPNVEMPSSEELGAALNVGDIKVTYTAETDSADAEYSWPYKIVTKDDYQCIVPANAGYDRSYAILHVNVELKAGEAFMFDYFTSTEASNDKLVVLVDGRDIYQISGIGTAWEECCPWVAFEDGVYEITFVYNKDSSDKEGDDVVYLKSFRTLDKSEVKPTSYIPREAATNPTDDGTDYTNYVDVFLNETDGYYHVGSADGPILLARLIYNTRFSDTWVTQNLYETNSFKIDGVEYFDVFNKYCNYAANSKLYTYCSVTAELRMLLEAYVKAYGFDTHEKTWLQLCIYYDAYGQTANGDPVPQLEDPIKGLSAHSAFTAVLGSSNRVEYQGMGILPRGYLYEFIPETTGVYRVTSMNTDQELIGWIFSGNDAEWIANGDRILYTSSDVGERITEELLIRDDSGTVTGFDSYNVSMVAFMEAGKAYYIDIAFSDVYGAGSFNFEIKNIGDAFDYFIVASPGPFTFELGPNETIGDTIAGGINVKLGDDGYYHHLKEDGSLGSVLYADFLMTTSIFTGESLEKMVDKGAFNFKLSEDDHVALQAWKEADMDEDKLKVKWGASFDDYWALYQMDDIILGKYHGNGDDLTEEMRGYIDQKLDEADHPERQGCVMVDERLAEILQILMDKYTFSGVDHSWTKLCYYYEYLGQ